MQTWASDEQLLQRMKQPGGQGPVLIKPDDQTGWYAEQKSFRIDVSPDKMKVWLLLFPDGKFKSNPSDEARTDHLVIRPVGDCESPILPPTLQMLNEEIQRRKIIHCDLGEVMRELASPTFVPVMIGKGKEPVPGKDAELELFFNENIEDSYEEVNGVVDFRNRLKIPYVRKGDRIARKLPMTESEPGYDVFGMPLEAPRPKDFVLLGGQNVRVWNNEIFAEQDGRPRITGDKIKCIDITTSHVIPGDVDLKTGNIVFAGDVHIRGNVLDGMIVEALGNVYVAGSVYRATISATGSICVKGHAIGSKLYTGHYGVLFNRLFQGATKLNERLTQYRQLSGQLRQLAAERGQAVTDRQAHQLLMESRIKDLPELSRAILGCISSLQSIRKNEMDHLKQKLEMLAKPHLLQQGEVEPFMVHLQMQLVETIEKIRTSEEAKVCTDLQQCHLTEIMSDGDILIRRQGVLQSRLYSKGNIVFCQSNAVCRGSELEAEQVISAMIVGGVSGGSARLKAGKKVTASLIYEGKVIVGKFAKEILDPVEHVCFQVRSNRLVAEPISMEPREMRHVVQ